jgi:hypothetical protein
MVQVFLLSMSLIGSATSVLVFIVWPKIKRVLSGEMVIVSKLLSNFRSSSISLPPTGEQNQRRIILAVDDPLPRQLEADIIAMEALLRGVTNARYVVLTDSSILY